MDRPYRIQEGCFVLPETFTDRSVNIFILEGNERTSPSLNISRDTLKPDEDLPAYIDRQIALMKKISVSTGYCRERLHRQERAMMPLWGNKLPPPINPGKRKCTSVRPGLLQPLARYWSSP